MSKEAAAPFGSEESDLLDESPSDEEMLAESPLDEEALVCSPLDEEVLVESPVDEDVLVELESSSSPLDPPSVGVAMAGMLTDTEPLLPSPDSLSASVRGI